MQQKITRYIVKHFVIQNKLINMIIQITVHQKKITKSWQKIVRNFIKFIAIAIFYRGKKRKICKKQFVQKSREKMIKQYHCVNRQWSIYKFNIFYKRRKTDIV